jgi:protein-L-isoaspartate(D-aspartate) O-methyltransferase
MISAGAPAVPRTLLLSQLAEGGIAVLPTGPLDRQMLVRVRRKGGDLEVTELCACRFVKLIGAEGWSND